MHGTRGHNPTNKKDGSIISTLELENSHDNSMPLIASDEVENTGEIPGHTIVEL